MKKACCINMRALFLYLLLIMIFSVAACSESSQEVVELKRFPVDSLDGIITQTGIGFDKEISSDRKGSLRITVAESTVIRLFEISDISVENARLLYQAKVRTKDIQGQVFLEMWCHFPGKGEFFSRSLQSPLSGATEWTSIETPFFLKKGQKPLTIRVKCIVNKFNIF